MPNQTQWPVDDNRADQPGVQPAAMTDNCDAQDSVWLLHVRGLLPQQIGATLGRSTDWVRLTIARLLELRDRDRQPVTGAHVEKLVDEVCLIRQAAWSGWEQSQVDKVRTVTKTKPAGPRGGGGEEKVVTTEPQAGNPASLRILIECNKRESSLRGIERPTTVPSHPRQPLLDLDALIEQLTTANAQEQRLDTPDVESVAHSATSHRSPREVQS